MQILKDLHLDKNFMQKLFISTLFYFIISSSFGQKYYSADIIKKADSIMIAVVGQKIFEEHYQFDSASYFETKTSFNDALIKTLTKSKKTKGAIKFIVISYIFYIKKYEQPFISTSLILDRNLNLTKPIDTSFIPAFISRGTKNDFLTKDDVLKIAKSKFAKKGLKPVETSLRYDHYKKVYVWTVVNITDQRKGYKDEINAEVELLEIDASNGRIINFYPNALQGHIH
jgi:hypothetical protein